MGLFLEDNRIYIVVIQSNQIIKKFETNGLPLKIGLSKIAEEENLPRELKVCTPLSIFMYQPDGIAEYTDPAPMNLYGDPCEIPHGSHRTRPYLYHY